MDSAETAVVEAVMVVQACALELGSVAAGCSVCYYVHGECITQGTEGMEWRTFRLGGGEKGGMNWVSSRAALHIEKGLFLLPFDSSAPALAEAHLRCAWRQCVKSKRRQRLPYCSSPWQSDDDDEPCPAPRHAMHTGRGGGAREWSGGGVASSLSGSTWGRGRS